MLIILSKSLLSYLIDDSNSMSRVWIYSVYSRHLWKRHVDLVTAELFIVDLQGTVSLQSALCFIAVFAVSAVIILGGDILSRIRYGEVMESPNNNPGFQGSAFVWLPPRAWDADADSQWFFINHHSLLRSTSKSQQLQPFNGLINFGCKHKNLCHVFICIQRVCLRVRWTWTLHRSIRNKRTLTLGCSVPAVDGRKRVEDK